MSDKYDSPTLNRLCDALEGYPMRYGMNPQQKHLYCDTCSEVIYPGQDATHYLCDRLVLGPDDFDVDMRTLDHEESGFRVGDFFMLRVEHRECESTKIPYPCRGYTEIFFDASWDADFEMERPTIMDVSTKNDGLPWSPEEAYNATNACIEGEYDERMGQKRPAVTLREHLLADPTAMGPHDILIHIIALGIDPRHVIGDDGEIIAGRNCGAIREDFGREGSLLAKWSEQGDPPPGFRFPRKPGGPKHGGEFDFQKDESFSPDADDDTDE